MTVNKYGKLFEADRAHIMVNLLHANIKANIHNWW